MKEVNIEELVKRYETNVKKRRSENKSEKIRQIAKEVIGNKEYAKLKDIVKVVRERMKDEIPKNQIYQRVRQVLQKEYMFGMDKDNVVVVIKNGPKTKR